MFTPELVTVLWRLERNREERSALVYTHPHGLDLRAMVGAELLHAQVFADMGDVVREAANWRRDLEALRWAEVVER